MKISFVTLFPEFIQSYINTGLLGRAQQKNIFQFAVCNLRDFSEGNYKSVDDTVYGGGDGALIQYAPLKKALNKVTDINALNTLADRKAAGDGASDFTSSDAFVVYLSPQGRKLDLQLINELKDKKHLVLISGRYAGVDQRFISQHVNMEVSVGDYVLSGGELPSLVLVESLSRQLEGVLGNETSAKEDSFQDGLLEAPQYTKPAEIEGMKVPAVLMSGDHKKISMWKKNMSVLTTLSKRDDLISLRKDIDWSEVVKFYNLLSEEDKTIMQIKNLHDKIKKYSL